MKIRTIISILLLLVFTVCGCSQNNGVDNVTITPQPKYSDDSNSPDVTDYGTSPVATAVDTIAYCFSDGSTTQVYGGVEYENTGDCPLVVTNAKLTFATDAGELIVDFEPIAYRYCVVYPGEHSYLAAWNDWTDEEKPSSAEITEALLTVTAVEPDRIKIDCDNSSIVKNYPDFATVSGDATNTSDIECSLNIIYIGLYDSNDKLLGVWHFSENTTLYPDEIRHYSTHLRSLNIEGIEEKTVTIKSTGYGFE